jgi:hypothetical protein
MYPFQSCVALIGPKTISRYCPFAELPHEIFWDIAARTSFYTFRVTSEETIPLLYLPRTFKFLILVFVFLSRLPNTFWNIIVFGDNNSPEITFFGNSFNVFGKVDPVTKVKLCRSYTVPSRKDI